MIAWVVVLLVLCGGPVQAATYYVATTGNDATGNGSAANPWANPQKCIGTVGPGDVCTIADGTYADTNGDGIVLYITNSTGAIDGAVGNPVTIKSTNQYGAKLRMSSASSVNAYGVRACRPDYVIEGFDITDDNLPTTQGASAGSTGVSLCESGGSARVVVRKNRIHHIARNVCSNSVIGNAGVGGRPGTGVIVEDNEIYAIGRKRNGEDGCSTTLYQNDHGIYVWNVNNFTVQRNQLDDNGRGYAIQVYASGQSSTGVYIYNNTIVQPTLSGSAPTACMLLSYTNTDVQIKNNIFSNCPSGYALTWFAPATQTNVVLSSNVSDSADADLNNPSLKPSSGVSASGNIVGSATINFTNPGARLYTLATGSSAIDACANVGLSYRGAAPDCGAFESGGLTVVAGRFYMAKSFASTLFPMGSVSTNISAPPGAALAVAMQVRCEDPANCSNNNHALYYSCPACDSGGIEQMVPTVDSGDFLEMWGSASGVGLLTGAHGANLIGGETHISGDTSRASATVASYNLTDNSSTVMRWIVVLQPEASNGLQYCFKVKEQTGVSLSAHVPAGGLCVVVGAASANAGP